MSLIDDYFRLWQRYRDEYGKQCVLLYQVGSFYEFYQIKNDKEEVGNIDDVVDILRLIKTRRNKAKPEVNRSNPEMAGFPAEQLQKFVNLLLNNQFTVVVYEQYCVNDIKDVKEAKSEKAKFDRRLSKIYSPGTILDPQSDDTWMVTGFVEEDTISVCCIDISIGKTILVFLTDNHDEKFFNLLNSLKPVEIVIYNLTDIKETKSQKETEFLKAIEHSFNWHYYTEIPKITEKIQFQNEFLSKIFKPDLNTLSPLEYLDLEMYPSLAQVLVLTLRFIENHDSSILKNLRKPEIRANISDKEKGCQLIGDVEQLDIFDTDTHSKSIFSIVNFTQTIMGKRLLKDRIAHPITSSVILQKRYKHIEEFIGNKDLAIYRAKLKGLPDFSRFHRKIAVAKLSPTELCTLDSQYQVFSEILTYIQNDRNARLFRVSFLRSSDVEAFQEWLTEYKSSIRIDVAVSCTFEKVEQSFFNEGIDSDIDDLNLRISELQRFFETTRNEIENLISDPKKAKTAVKLVWGDIEGYHYAISNIRASKLVEIKYKHALKFNRMKSHCKITFEELTERSFEYQSLLKDLKTRVLELYMVKLNEWFQKYSNVFDWIVSTVAQLDLYTSSAKCALEYRYSKPQIVKEACLEIKDLRHPLVEKFNDSVQFVTNDLDLDKLNSGLLLYGLNGVGKSVYLKSVAVIVLLAQSGLYVPCRTLRFRPFTKIISKILNRDNIIKGKSTFILELEQIRNMVNGACDETLILSDETCSGTEKYSAISLVASLVNYLKSKTAFFIMSSHFHELTDFTSTMTKHFQVEIKDGNIIFNRKLQEGDGNKLYGLEIAKAVGINKDVIESAFQVRTSLLTDGKVSISRYNKKVILTECAICKSKRRPLHTHHIIFQKTFRDFSETADSDRKIDGMHKNVKANLVVLCEGCHNDVHAERITIHGYRQTPQGVFLDYEKVTEKNEKEREGEEG